MGGQVSSEEKVRKAFDYLARKASRGGGKMTASLRNKLSDPRVLTRFHSTPFGELSSKEIMEVLANMADDYDLLSERDKQFLRRFLDPRMF